MWLPQDQACSHLAQNHRGDLLPSWYGDKRRRPSPGADTSVTAFPATGTVRINVFLFITGPASAAL